MSRPLFVPYGINPKGQVINAADALRDTVYECPLCRSVLVYHAGQTVVRHFAHKAGTTCSLETVLHKTAKLLIAQAIADHVNPSLDRTISITCQCVSCSIPFPLDIPKTAFTTARQEEPIGAFVCDVVAMREDSPALGIEIRVTHKVDEAKARALPIFWVELIATDVLKSPTKWVPSSSRLKPMRCTKCRDYKSRLDALAIRWNIETCSPAKFLDADRSDYLIEVEKCWKCKEEIPVFWWLGVPFCQKEPPRPRPKTVAFRQSKMFGGSYWANTCPGCQSIQGDNFLFLGESPTFNRLPLRETPETKANSLALKNAVFGKFLRNF